jgi:hypothetical protein
MAAAEARHRESSVKRVHTSVSSTATRTCVFDFDDSGGNHASRQETPCVHKG